MDQRQKILTAMNVLLGAAVIFTTSACSLLRASSAPTTPFLTHASELHPQYDRAPWDAVWSSSPEQIVVKLPEIRHLYVAPVNTQYLNLAQNKAGHWVSARQVDLSDVQAISDLIRKTFVKALSDTAKTNLIVEETPGPSNLTLEIALTELAPTKVAVNGLTDVGGLFVPGGKLVENVIAIGGQVAGGAFASGSIAIEMKLVDSHNGTVIAEAKDRETDPASLIPNYRDFEQFGWSRKTITAWANQLAEAFSTPATTRISGETGFSFVPW